MLANREELGKAVGDVEELEGLGLETGDWIVGGIDPREWVGWSC